MIDLRKPQARLKCRCDSGGEMLLRSVS
jgi:hypothetical protein